QAAELDQPGNEDEEFQVLRLVTLPGEPVDLVILAIGIVVAVLAAADFVPHEQHGRTLRQQERRHGVATHPKAQGLRSEEHTSELQSRENLVCRLLLEKKK